MVILNQRTVQVSETAGDPAASPFVSISYTETKKGFFQKRYLGDLAIDVVVASAGYNRAFARTIDVTNFKKIEGDAQVREFLIGRVVDYIAGELVPHLELGLESHLEEGERCQLEEKIVKAIAEAMDLPAVVFSYREKKVAVHEEAARRKERAVEEQKEQLSQQIRSRLQDLEFAALYELATDASRDLEYTLTRDAIQSRVNALFDSGDNLQHRPLFNPHKKGKWAEFIRGIAGDGLYNKLRNVEEDLDHFYAEVVDEVQSKCHGREAGAITREDYHGAIRARRSLAEILALFGRECDANVKILQRLAEKQKEDPFDYGVLASELEEALSFKGGLYTILDPLAKKIKPFSVPKCSTSTPDATTFPLYLAKVRDALTEYFNMNGPVLRFPSKQQRELRDKDEIMRISHGGDAKVALTGSCGYYHQRPPDVYENNNNYFSFYLVTGEIPEKMPFICMANHILNDSVVPVVHLNDAYENVLVAAKDVLEKAVKKAEIAAEKEEIVRLKKQIDEFHPYLAQEIEFAGRFYAGMKSRFERIFAETVPVGHKNE